MTTDTHICIHEDQFIGQSRAIERLDAELGYKKEKLDELKKDNERMDKKLDEIKNCVNKLILASKRDDDRLKDIINDQNNRITALETTNRTLKWIIGLSVSVLGVCIAAIALVMTHLL
jgi:predicted RNase H-like nuclease (RuvC/YqgF family)